MAKHLLLPVGDPSEAAEAASPFLSPRRAWTLLLLLWLAVHFAALFAPPLLDDADATHANAAQHMALSGDWVTLKVNGIRYLEKPPLPYWLVALDYRVFGFNVFATHLPMALGVLGVAALGWQWARRAYGDRAAFYTALAFLTSIGVFLFTRVYIPEVLLTLFVSAALYCFLTALEDAKPQRFYAVWALIAVAMLVKGLIAPVFFLSAALPYLVLTGDWRRWREFRIPTGLLLFLLIAAPWHILAGLRNPDHGHPVGNVPGPGGVHGFFYFYFINEHVLRFLGRRYPHDYNKQPAWVFWLGHLAWLFPWSLYFPLAVSRAWRTRRAWLSGLRPSWGTLSTGTAPVRFNSLAEAEQVLARRSFRKRSLWLLSLYAAFILVFFSISTNQEYYTFPAYFSLLLLTAGVLASAELRSENRDPRLRESVSRWLLGAHAVFAVVGVASALALGYGLWSSRHLPFVPDIGTLLAHRAVGNYSLSMSHLFDLTGPSFAALRLPAALAAVVFLIGPAVAWQLRRRGENLKATVSVAFTAAVFLIAAHIAFVRFAPMLSSRAMADTINSVAGDPLRDPAAAGRATLMIYGDQSSGSSVIFYTHRQALLVNGRSSSMIWGSWYPDAPHVFLTDADLEKLWGAGNRKFLFAEGQSAEKVRALLGSRAILVQELADKALFTDRPL